MSDLHCPARIIIARHGEAEYETPGLGVSGGSLTVLGREQARALGERLRSEKVAGVICSDLSRAVQTAEIAAGILGLPVRVRERLQEFAVGDSLGRDDSELIRDLARAWLEGDLEPRLPGGESGQHVVDRVLWVLEDAADQFRGETLLAVTHAGVILALFGLLAPGSPYAPAHEGDVPNGSAYVFERDADGWRAVG